jgi:hypothetical protein
MVIFAIYPMTESTWTEDQLRRFYEKWKKMSLESKQPQEVGKDAWEEALKSIGLLRPNRNRPGLQESRTRRQDNQRVTEAQRLAAPPAVRERYKSYNDNVGK